MPYNIRIISTYTPRKCGIGTFSRDLSTALAHFTGEVGYIRVAAIDNGNGPYDIPVDLTIDQYTPQSWTDAIVNISARARESENPTVVLLQHEYGLDPDEKGEDGQGFGNVFLEPAGKCRRGLVIAGDHVLEPPIGFGAVVGVVDTPDVIGDFCPH